MTTPQQAPGPILSDERIVEICEETCGWLAGAPDPEIIAFARAIIAEVAAPVGEVVAATDQQPIYQVELDPKFNTWMDINANEVAVWNRKHFNVRTIYAALPPQAAAPATGDTQ